MKKDIYITIAHENTKALFELYKFVSSWDYPKEERDFYKDDLGKVETKSHVFRFIKHINVKKDNDHGFFLSKPDESNMVSISLNELEESMIGLIPKQGSSNGMD